MLKLVNDFKFNSKFSVIINHKDNVFCIQTLEGKDVLPQCKKNLSLLCYQRFDPDEDSRKCW